MNKTALSKFCEQVYLLEQELDLPNLKIQNTYFWQLIRMEFYYTAAQKLGIFDNPHPALFKVSKATLLYRALFKFPWSGSRNHIERMVLTHSRKVNGVDIYSESLIEKYKNNILICDKPLSQHFNNNAYSIDLINYISIIMSKFIKIKLTPEEKDLASKITQKISNKLNVDVNIEALITKRVGTFLRAKELYKKFLSHYHNLSEIYIVVGHSHLPLIAAAKELNIHTNEIQHATLSPYHLGYHFPNWDQVPYATDKMLTFGTFWNTAVDHDKSMSFDVIGAPKPLIEKLSGEIKKTKTIVFLSQGIVAPKLYHFATQLAQENLDYEIIYRLHPSEALCDFKRVQGVTLSKNEQDTYKLLSQAEYAVGVASTAVYEALVLNCKAILINIEGVEYLEPLATQHNVSVVDTTEEFVDAMKKAETIDASAFYKVD